MTPISVNIRVYPFLATTDIVSFFTDIGEKADIGPDITPISVSYRCIPVSCHHRYRIFRRCRLRYVQQHRFQCVINITIYRYRRFTISGRITRYRGRRRRCRTCTGSSPPPAAALAAAGPLPRQSNRPSLGTHRLSVDQGGYLVFTGPRRLRLLQKTQ
jgi:hypothetical protein